MIKDKTRILINSSVVTLSTTLDKFIFVVINIIIARYLSIEHFGEYTTALGYATFFSYFINLGINLTIIRLISIDPENESTHFGNALFTKAALSIIVYGIMAISLLFTNYNNNTIKLILIFGIVRFSTQIITSFYSLFDSKEKFVLSSFFTFLFSFSFLTATILIIVFNGTYFDFAYSRLVLVFILIIIIGFYTFKQFVIKIDLHKFKSFILSVFTFTQHSIYSNIIDRVNILILSLMQGTLYSGIFNNGFIFFSSLTFIPTNIGRVLAPYLYKIKFDKNPEKFQFTFDVFTKLFGVLSFYLFIIFFLYSDIFVPVIFGKKYLASIKVVQIVSFGIPFLFNIVPIIIRSLDKQEYNNRVHGIAAVINIISNIVFINYYKSEGAAIAMVTTFLAIFILSHAILFKNGYIRLYNACFSYLSFIIITIICFSLKKYLLSDLFWVYSIICITISYLLLVLLFLVRKNDIRIFKESFGIR